MSLHDTVKLLKECSAGIKMGVLSIDDTLDQVESTELRKILERGKTENERIGNVAYALLRRCGSDGKDPSLMAKGMAHMKTNLRMAYAKSDSTVAELITDGCNMGIKSLNKYLNKYDRAGEQSRDVAKELINAEKKLALDISPFL